MSEWQPIETAPKDGTPILVACPYSSGVAVENVRWIDRPRARGWRFHNYGPALGVQPTHWMPLPEPPK